MNEKVEYEGKAEITEVYTKSLEKWQAQPKNGPALSEDEMASAFNVVFKVKTPNGDEYTTDPLEISSRELTGRMLEIWASRVQGRNPVQSDVTLGTLARLKLIADAKLDCITEVFATVGREVSIKRYTTESNGKSFSHTNFSFGPKKLSQNELMEKIARLQGKPVPTTKTIEELLPEEPPF